MGAKDLVSYYRKRYPLVFMDDSNTDRKIGIRYEEAWKLARRAASLLKERFGAQKVVVFGSLTDRSRFTEWSDVDLAVWGVPDELFYAAVGAVIGLSADFMVDLVDAEDCPDKIRKSIESEGVQV
ncbi:MAG: nucleotidyltransferase family protein [Moorellaceae bacterium]